MFGGLVRLREKIRLMLFLGRRGLLPLLDGLSPYRYFIKPVSLFVKPVSERNLVDSAKIFLAENRDVFFEAAADEVAALVFYRTGCLFRPDLPAENSADVGYLGRRAGQSGHNVSCLRLFREILAAGFPQFMPLADTLSERLDRLRDMRLYASDIQHLADSAASFEKTFVPEIDWIRTTKEELFFFPDDKVVLAEKLTPRQQKALAGLFACLLFERSLFVSSWRRVAVKDREQVAFTDFDFVYGADEALKDYALSLAAQKELLPAGGLMPSSAGELKLCRAVALLKTWCPAVDVAVVFGEYASRRQSRNSSIPDGQKASFLTLMKKYGMDYGIRPAEEASVMKGAARFFSSAGKKKNSRSVREALLYWGPLLLALAVIFIYIYRGN